MRRLLFCSLTLCATAACSKVQPVGDWTTRPLVVAPRNVGELAFEAGVPAGLDLEPRFSLEQSVTFLERHRVGGVRVTFTVVTDVAPRNLDDAEAAANAVGDLRILKRQIVTQTPAAAEPNGTKSAASPALVVVTTNEAHTQIAVDSWTMASDGRAIHCKATEDRLERPIENLGVFQSALEKICQSVKAPGASPGSRPPAALSAAPSGKVPEPVLGGPDAMAFVSALGDEKQNLAAFRAFARGGLRDDGLCSYAFDGVRIVSAEPAGKATCYKILGKVAVGSQAFTACFDGGKLVRLTRLGLEKNP